MRSLVTSTFALALALAPAAAIAQTTTTTAQQPPAGQPPPAAAQPPAPAGPKVGFKAPVGMLLVQIKPDQTTVFEEMMGKIKSGVGNATDPVVKAQAGSWKYYRAAEPGAQGAVMYIVLIDPAVAGTEYQFLEVLNKTLSDEEKRKPETQEMYKKYAGAIAQMNIMNLTPAGGGL
jgi:hypothetical protein